MSSVNLEFSGFLLLEGIEYIPKDLPLSPKSLREWAYQQGFVTDPEFQILGNERIQKLSSIFSTKDEPMLAIAIHESENAPFYMEYFFLPVKALIRLSEVLKVVYWRMIPYRQNAPGTVLEYGEVQIGFWYPGCSEELCTVSNAKKVIEKFGSFVDNLQEDYSKDILKDGSKEVNVDGAVLARFFKEGRYFDVELSLIV